ncbi:MAG: hypothetical protein LIO49_06285 [Ruminococcus sp.]|nr:hypothetical protein [Ruminococcus sp.]
MVRGYLNRHSGSDYSPAVITLRNIIALDANQVRLFYLFRLSPTAIPIAKAVRRSSKTSKIIEIISIGTTSLHREEQPPLTTGIITYILLLVNVV